MATLVEVAGAKHPANVTATPSRRWKEKVYCPSSRETRAQPSPIFGTRGHRAVRMQQWKLSRGKIKTGNFTMSGRPHGAKKSGGGASGKGEGACRLYDAWARRCNVVPPDELPRELQIIPAGAPAARRGGRGIND